MAFDPAHGGYPYTDSQTGETRRSDYPGTLEQEFAAAAEFRAKRAACWDEQNPYRGINERNPHLGR